MLRWDYLIELDTDVEPRTVWSTYFSPDRDKRAECRTHPETAKYQHLQIESTICITKRFTLQPAHYFLLRPVQTWQIFISRRQISIISPAWWWGKTHRFATLSGKSSYSGTTLITQLQKLLKLKSASTYQITTEFALCRETFFWEIHFTSQPSTESGCGVIIF